MFIYPVVVCLSHVKCALQYFTYLLFKHKTNNLPVYKQQTKNKVLKFKSKKNVKVKRM